MNDRGTRRRGGPSLASYDVVPGGRGGRRTARTFLLFPPQKNQSPPSDSSPDTRQQRRLGAPGLRAPARHQTVRRERARLAWVGP